MRTENLENENCPQRDSTEYEEYAEVSSIYLPEDIEQEREQQALSLIDRVVSVKNMETAMKRVKRNNGAPGVDGKTVAETIASIRLSACSLRSCSMSSGR